MIRRIAGVLVAAALLPGCVVTHTEVVRVRHAGDTATTGSSASSASAAPSSHVVSRGETLYSIAFRAGMDWRDVAARNGLTPPYTIYPGQRLQLGGQPAVSTAGTVSPSPSTAVTKPLEPGSVEVRPIGDVAATPPPSGATSPRTPPASSAASRSSASANGQNPGWNRRHPAGTASRVRAGRHHAASEPAGSADAVAGGLDTACAAADHTGRNAGAKHAGAGRTGGQCADQQRRWRPLALAHARRCDPALHR
jgi:lipoprotein NlpD